jgi:hypothetical protein
MMGYLLSRNVRIEEDLVDQLFNSSEKRLARILLLLTRFGKDGQHETVVPRISQETPAEMVGTSRSRVSALVSTRQGQARSVEQRSAPSSGRVLMTKNGRSTRAA